VRKWRGQDHSPVCLLLLDALAVTVGLARDRQPCTAEGIPKRAGKLGDGEPSSNPISAVPQSPVEVTVICVASPAHWIWLALAVTGTGFCMLENFNEGEMQ
jgi:hypothetical protein